MTKALPLLLGLLIVNYGYCSDHHSGHSDDLLFLLKDKIALYKLQENYPQLSSEGQQKNKEAQLSILNRALPRLKRYVAIPESQYPNLEIYHQSLQSRAALMNDFTKLLVQSHCLTTTKCTMDNHY